MRQTYDALVLAGGEGRRLGGVSKAEVPVAGRALLDHVLEAVADARCTVVVGPPELAGRGFPTAMEEPPGGGPVAGIDAGVRHLGDGSAPVLVVACDAPLAGDAVPLLLAALTEHPAADGAVLVDADGRRQALLAVYRRAPLEAALEHRRADGGVHGCPVWRLVGSLTLTEVADVTGAAADADTWEAVAELEAIILGRRER